MEKEIFIFQGFHFRPVRKLKESETGYQMIRKRLRRDPDLGFFDGGSGHDKPPYSYEAFYKAASESGMDLFYCLETGKLYAPGEHELFVYTEDKEAE